MTTKIDLDVWRGSARSFTFVIYDSAGNLEDVSGWTVVFNVRASHAASGTVISRSTAAGGVTLGGSNGEITVALTGAMTGAIAAGTYRHTLGRTDSGSEAVLAEGAFRLKANSVLPT